MESLKAIIALCITVVLWASSFVGIRYAVVSYTPGELALLRYLVASVVMLVLYWRLPKRTAIAWDDVPQLFLTGALGIGLYNLALNYGEVTVTAGVGSFILGMIPVVAMILAVFFLREKAGVKEWIGVAISICGLAIILWSGSAGLNFDKGVYELLFAAFLGALYAILVKSLLKKYNFIEVTSFSIWSGTMAILIFAPSLFHTILSAPMSATWDIVYMGIFPGAVGYVLWGYGLSRLPATKAVAFLYAMPIIATGMGIAILHEWPSHSAFLGGLIALFGVFVVNYRARKSELESVRQAE